MKKVYEDNHQKKVGIQLKIMIKEMKNIFGNYKILMGKFLNLPV